MFNTHSYPIQYIIFLITDSIVTWDKLIQYFILVAVDCHTYLSSRIFQKTHEASTLWHLKGLGNLMRKQERMEKLQKKAVITRKQTLKKNNNNNK